MLKDIILDYIKSNQPCKITLLKDFLYKNNYDTNNSAIDIIWKLIDKGEIEVCSDLKLKLTNNLK